MIRLRMRCVVPLVAIAALTFLFFATRDHSSVREDHVGRNGRTTDYSTMTPQLPLAATSVSVPRNYTFIPLSQEVESSVERFVFFIGYARSSHSIVGSMLDAHPNVVISHEYALFKQWHLKPQQHMNRTWLYNTLYNSSRYTHFIGMRRRGAMKKGYSLNIENSWQGRYDGVIRVIGDKSGGMTAKAFRVNRKMFVEQFSQLQSTVKVPIHAIHVIRNPFDNIATMLLYNNHISKAEVDIEHPFINMEKLQAQIMSYFNQVRGVVEMIQLLGLNLLEIHSDDLVHRPSAVLHSLCSHFHLACTEEYVRQCTNKLFKSESRTRFLIQWTPFLINSVGQEMKKYPFFDRYSFYH